MNLRTAAVRYAERGLFVFPCHPRSKTPALRHGLKDATDDPGMVAGWWEQWPEANIAILTGGDSGLVVLDVDGDEGARSLDRLERTHGPLPYTTTARTPGGGSHIYFAHPMHTVRNSTSLVGPKLDIRGDGGYVIAPPSIGPSDRRYEYVKRAPLASVPGWLLRLQQPDDNVTHLVRTPAARWAAMVRDGLAEGERNTGLTRIVGHLLNRDVDGYLVLELAQLINTRSRPPLPNSEVRTIVESISGRHYRRMKGHQ